MKKLIIIPVYNESGSIEKVINKINEIACDFDYIVINDCSTDDTKEICIRKNYNFIDLSVNLGIGGGVQTGYKFAYEKGYDYAVQLDGDGQHDPCYLNELLKVLQEEDIDLVIGSRFLKKDGFQSTKARRLGIKMLSSLIRIIYKQDVKDVTSGFRMCNRKVIRYFANEYPRDYPEPESIVALLRNGYSIKEVPVNMQERQAGVSSINFMNSVYYMIKVTLAILIESLRE